MTLVQALLSSQPGPKAAGQKIKAESSQKLNFANEFRSQWTVEKRILQILEKMLFDKCEKKIQIHEELFDLSIVFWIEPPLTVQKNDIEMKKNM